LFSDGINVLSTVYHVTSFCLINNIGAITRHINNTVQDVSR